jgi:hypothetical protein
MRFSTNNGSSYDAGNNYFNTYIRYDSTPAAAAGGANTQNAAILTDVSTAGAALTNLQNFHIKITGCGLTNQRVLYLSNMVIDNGTRQAGNQYSGFYNTVATGTQTTAVQLIPGTGNFTSGTFKLYGMK